MTVLLLNIKELFITFMCCLFCFSTDQQLDATACKMNKGDKTHEYNEYIFLIT